MDDVLSKQITLQKGRNVLRGAVINSPGMSDFLGAKVVAWILFIPCFAWATHDAFSNSNLSKEPRGPGLAGAKGYYNVTEFRFE